MATITRRAFGITLLFFSSIFWGISLAAAGSGPVVGFEVVESALPSRHYTLEVSKVVSNLDRPWALAFLPDGSMLITLRPGKLLLISGQRVLEVGGLPAVAFTGQGGLLDIALDRNFSVNQRVYITYAGGSAGRFGTFVGSGRLERGTAGATLRDFRVLWSTPEANRSSAGQHFGSRVLHAADGFLYVTLGDRGSMNRAQDPSDPAGSILRLSTDGSVPSNNPFLGIRQIPGLNGESLRPLPEVFAFGSRNSQGITQDSAGRIWFHEHGPRGGDEINLLVPGANYGWPRVTFGVNYSGTEISSLTTLPGVQGPEIHWTPSIAPSGFSFYSGGQFPLWTSSAFVGALAGQHLRRVEYRDGRIVDQEVFLQGRLGRIRDVRPGPDGYLYVLTDGSSAGLFRIGQAP